MGEQMRASDADRDAAAAALRGHFAAGRLTAAELEARLAVALSARTAGELQAVLADLPPAEAGGLERSYRRLLDCYPAAWRRAHEQEMVEVVMTGAPADRARPSLGEAANLAAGGLRVRCQRTRFGGEPAWRDALAVVTVLLPLVVLTIFAAGDAWVHDTTYAVAFNPVNLPWLAAQLTVPVALAGIALARRHRRAALAAGTALIPLAVLAGPDPLSVTYDVVNPYVLLAFALQVCAVTASPGPRRALALLTWRGAALAALAVMAAAAIAVASYPLSTIVVVAIVAVMMVSSSLGRWLLLLLGIPLWAFLTNPDYAVAGSKIAVRLDFGPLDSLNQGLLNVTSWPGQFYLIPAVLLGLFAAAAIRDSRRPRHLAGPSE